jgi:hypothetical protein
MSSNVINQAPFLRTSRNFPNEINQLTVEINRSYVDIANNVNNRTIGLFPTNRPAVNGESWFITNNQRQQGFRQIYTFTSTGSIPHYINILDISLISPKCYGSFRDSSNNYYGCIFASNASIPGQVSFYITPNSSISALDGNIVILAGAGAPTIQSGIIVIEWISDP